MDKLKLNQHFKQLVLNIYDDTFCMFFLQEVKKTNFDEVTFELTEAKFVKSNLTNNYIIGKLLEESINIEQFTKQNNIDKLNFKALLSLSWQKQFGKPSEHDHRIIEFPFKLTLKIDIDKQQFIFEFDGVLAHCF
jgi:hypothetical protein